MRRGVPQRKGHCTSINTPSSARSAASRRRPAAALIAAAAGTGVAAGCTVRIARSDVSPEKAQYTVVWSPQQIRTVLEKYLESRQLENILAALGVGALVLADMSMLSGTGIVGMVAGIGATVGYIAAHLEYVNDDPAFGRLRFIDVSPTHEALMGLLEYHNIKHEEKLLPDWEPDYIRVKRVGERIAKAAHIATLAIANETAIASIGCGTHKKSTGVATSDSHGDTVSSQLLTAPHMWEFNVVDSDEVNAFVLPGGKVFVYRGMLRQLESDDELAVILGHEAAHVQARHAAER